MRTLLCLALAGCVAPAPQYDCNMHPMGCVAPDGTQGACEPSGNCAFPDPSCGDTGLRYDETAAPGRGRVCVLSATGTSTVAPQPVSLGIALGWELTTPPQSITFDTEVNGTTVVPTLHWFTGFCPPEGPTELPSNKDTCANQAATRIDVAAQTPGPYCLVATSDNAGMVGLRVFPSTTPPACVR